MTKRSTTTLARKLRELESAYAATLRRDLEEQTRRVELAVRRFPDGAISTLLFEGLGGMLSRSFAQGAFLLADFTEQMQIASDRDVLAVASNTGMPVGEVYGEWEPLGWQNGALVMWEDFVTGAGVRAGAEFQRQAALARIYDDDPAEGTLLRLFSFRPVRRMGRKGLGVFPSLISVFTGGIVTPAYGMVNAQREALFRELTRVANA